MGATSLLGFGLAIHGYGHGYVVAGSTSLRPTAAPAKGSAASTPSTTTPVSSAATSPTTTTTPSASATNNQKLGPLLSSTQYYPYAYELYPGPESNQARLATAGFDVQVTPNSAGRMTVTVSAIGSTQPAQTSTYPAGDRVYFIEASFGDDSGNSEYNYGDDGVVITDSTGRIVQ